MYAWSPAGPESTRPRNQASWRAHLSCIGVGDKAHSNTIIFLSRDSGLGRSRLVRSVIRAPRRWVLAGAGCRARDKGCRPFPRTPFFAGGGVRLHPGQRGRGRPKMRDNSRLRPPAYKFIERLVLAFAARRLGFRRQVHELLQELRVLTDEKAVGNKGLDRGHRTSIGR
jgi:hypothetical protein